MFSVMYQNSVDSLKWVCIYWLHTTMLKKKKKHIYSGEQHIDYVLLLEFKHMYLEFVVTYLEFHFQIVYRFVNKRSALGKSQIT